MPEAIYTTGSTECGVMWTCNGVLYAKGRNCSSIIREFDAWFEFARAKVRYEMNPRVGMDWKVRS